MPAPWVIPTLISLATTAVGSEISRREQQATQKRKLATQARLSQARTNRANQELAQKFAEATTKISPENQQALMQKEDAKNLKAFDDTEQNSEVKVGQGLNLGGKELAEFTKLKSDTVANSIKGNNQRKLFHSQFLSPGAVNRQVGNFADELALSRSRFADELHGQKLGDDLEVSAIKPNAGVLALADAIRIAGQMYGMYNMASSLGTTAPTTPDLTGLDGIVSTGYTAPASAGSTTSLGQAFGGGATQGFAPGNAMSMWAKPPTPAWPVSGGGWFGSVPGL